MDFGPRGCRPGTYSNTNPTINCARNWYPSNFQFLGHELKNATVMRGCVSLLTVWTVRQLRALIKTPVHDHILNLNGGQIVCESTAKRYSPDNLHGRTLFSCLDVFHERSHLRVPPVNVRQRDHVMGGICCERSEFMAQSVRSCYHVHGTEATMLRLP